MAILLIGSTGSGKSSLGNFLLDPSDENLFDKQCFKVAKANMPETQHVSKLPCHFEGTDYFLIDTPGLNESDSQDLKHMIQIVESVQAANTVMACILVVKFNAKIDAQYKTTVQYYKKLLPSLFERNVIIVMTDFATDDRSVMMRERQRLDVEQIKRNVVREIVNSGSLEYDPLLFTVDCLPVGDEERELNLNVRSAIFSKVASQIPILSKNIMVAKTAYLKNEDQKIIKSCEGENTGYRKRLEQMDQKLAEALQKIHRKKDDISEQEKTLSALKDDLRYKDSSESVVIGTWSVSTEWKFFKSLSKSFEKTTSCEIQSIDKWKKGSCKWKDFEETKYGVKGRVEGKFMRGIYAGLTLYASRRKRYEAEISSLNRQINEVEKHKQSLVEYLDEIRVHHGEYEKEIKELEDFIEKNEIRIKNHRSDYMTLEVARKRLQKLEGH